MCVFSAALFIQGTYNECWRDSLKKVCYNPSLERIPLNKPI